MGAELTIACVYRPGNGFDDRHPRKLQEMVQRHYRAPHRFVCLTTEALPGVETVPLVTGWPGWWAKLELFRPGLFPGPVVYSDLDVILMNEVTDLFDAAAERPFVATSKWTGTAPSKLQSAFMAWSGERDLSHIYHRFDTDVIPYYSERPSRWGDQGYIEDAVHQQFESAQCLFPGRFALYKQHVDGPLAKRKGFAPRGVSIVCFSGQPRPDAFGWQLPQDQ